MSLAAFIGDFQSRYCLQYYPLFQNVCISFGKRSILGWRSNDKKTKNGKKVN